MARILTISDTSIETAAETLRQGKLVAFPTETVYGLGGDATNDRAVAAIFAAKGRPRFNPLIVHLPDVAAARDHGVFDETADRLAAIFWPGPMTFVLPRQPGSPLSRLVSAGLDTVALRVPARDDARRLLKTAGIPVAAPSANRSGRLSPTTAQHVAQDLRDHVDLILDGGQCAVGLESTVLDLSSGAPTILRPGGITQEAVETALGRPIDIAGTDDTAPKSPGMLSSHYAPSLPLRLDAEKAETGEVLLGFGPSGVNATLNLSPTGDLVEAAANLFTYLHQLDNPTHRGIAIVPIPDRGLGRAINDRLRRAAVRP